MVKTGTPGQPHLPGIDPKKERYAALVRNNPAPTDLNTAEKFFRQHCDALIKIKGDHDQLRVVLKGTDQSEDEAKWQKTVDLDIYNRKNWEEKYVATAQKAHNVWIELESEKQ